MPTLRNFGPIGLFGSPFEWKVIECLLDEAEWNTNALGSANEGKSAQNVAIEATLIACITGTEDESLAFIEMKCRHGDPASLGDLSDRELIG